MMKRLLVIVGILIGILILGLAVFLATFDADRYRPLVITQLESALGKPVRLERLSLGWRGGIALELRQLGIYPDAKAKEPVAQVERLSAVARLLPFLRKEVRVSSIILTRPRVQITRDAQGNIDLAGVAVLAGPAVTPSPHPSSVLGVGHSGSPAAGGRSEGSDRTAAVGGAPMSLNVDSVRIEDGSLRWTDAMSSPPTDLWIKALDVTLKNVSMSRPVECEVRMAVFSEAQNVHLRGRLQMPTPEHPGTLEAVHLETDFSRLNTAQLMQSVPAMKALGLREELAGTLTASVDHVTLDPSGLARLAAQVHLADGKVALQQLGSPLEGVTVDALAKRGRIELTRASAKLSGGTIAMTGAVDQLETQPRTTFQANVERVALDTLLPASGPGEPQLRGRLSASFQGAAQGLDAPHITRTLSGQGRLTISDGVVANLNVLQEVFARLSILPGLVETMKAKLPASYQAKLTAKDTKLQQPIDLSVHAQDGALSFNTLRVVTDSFELGGAGRVGLDGSLAAQTMLQIEPELSAAIVKSVKELQQLTDQHGRLTLPVAIQGALPRIMVLPDVQYVASRLVATKAQELLGNFLEKVLEKNR